jgi:2-polyprenyl-3-methyl-5-hydroxy-6-metoxy-1,4-benzoquinol methylase
VKSLHQQGYNTSLSGENPAGQETIMDAQQLNAAGRDQWNQKAEFWDNLHGDDGNRFHRTLVSPAVEKLLALQPGEHVLDIACGSGVMARRLAALGGKVTAVDFSPALV